MKNKFIWLYFILSFAFSFGLGLLVKDKYLLGAAALFFILTQAYFTINGKWQGEIIGIFSLAVNTFIFVFTSMYATAIFTLTVFLPLSIFKIINWKKHEQNKMVVLNNMSIKKTIITTIITTQKKDAVMQ